MKLKSLNENTSVSKLETINIDGIVKKGEAAALLTNTAAEMLEDLKKLKVQSEEEIIELNSLVNAQIHQILKYSSEHKLNIDSMVVDRSSMEKKLKILNEFRDKMKIF